MMHNLDASVRVRAFLHQVSASTLRQRCDDASDTVLMENNGVAPEWGCNQSLRDITVLCNCRVVAMLMLTLGVNGPLEFESRNYFHLTDPDTDTDFSGRLSDLF